MSARATTPEWVPHRSALHLLTESGRPFNHPRYRDACRDAFPHFEDRSFGAVASDGTQAAIALLAWRGGVRGGVSTGWVAESVPFGFGGVVATRPVSVTDTTAFLVAARRAARSRVLVARLSPLLTQGVTEAPGRHHDWTSMVRLVPHEDPESRYTARVRRSVRRALRAGAEVVRSTSADRFLPLYRLAASRRSFSYPDAFIRALARREALLFYEVFLDHEIVESKVALPGRDHWVYWLGAQNDAGRSVSAGFLSLSAMLRDAHRAGVRAIDLGGSAGLDGLETFKRGFGAEQVPVLVQRDAALLASAELAVLGQCRRAWALLSRSPT
jgi:hypothetical protein